MQAGASSDAIRTPIKDSRERHARARAEHMTILHPIGASAPGARLPTDTHHWCTFLIRFTTQAEQGAQPIDETQ